MALPSSPRLIHWRRLAAASSSGEASSRMATTAISIPWLRAPSSTRKGKRPLPAMRPHSPAGSALDGWFAKRFTPRLLHDSALRRFDEAEEDVHIFRAAELGAHAFDGLRGVQPRLEQQTE